MTMKKDQTEEAFSKEIDLQSLGNTIIYAAFDTSIRDDFPFDGSCDDEKFNGDPKLQRDSVMFTDKNILHCDHENLTEETHKDNTSDHKAFCMEKSETPTSQNDQIPEEDDGFTDKELSNQPVTVSEDLTASLADAAVTKNHSQATVLKYKSEVENETITFNFNSTTLQTFDAAVSYNAQDPGGETDSKLRVVNAQNLSNKMASGTSQCYPGIPEDSAVEGDSESKNTSLANKVSRDTGEASFSAASLAVHSDSIAYSGSLSLRSDASNTSAHSFAFPILQSEWNSSPTRMAKPDRKHFRKQKGWRSGIFCCRF